MSAEDVAHGRIGEIVSQVGQRPGEVIVTPSRVLACHANDQVLDFFGRRRSANPCSAVAEVPFLGDERLVPAQNGVGREDGADFR